MSPVLIEICQAALARTRPADSLGQNHLHKILIVDISLKQSKVKMINKIYRKSGSKQSTESESFLSEIAAEFLIDLSSYDVFIFSRLYCSSIHGVMCR